MKTTEKSTLLFQESIKRGELSRFNSIKKTIVTSDEKYSNRLYELIYNYYTAR